MRRAPAVAVVVLLLVAPRTLRGAMIWWDGSRSDEDRPPGKLLSDNDGYWGECVLTGVEYRYEHEPTNPADVWKNERDTFGRRLLDGRARGNWWAPVGVNYKPLVVVCDFKRTCTFLEVDVSTRSEQVAVEVECAANDRGPWTRVYGRPRDACPKQMFHRCKLSGDPTGRFLRLTVEAKGITWLEEVLVWGDAKTPETTPEAYRPVVPTPVVEGTAFSSIPGIPKTSFPDAAFWAWKRSIGEAARQPAVWSTVPTWEAITTGPLLPEPPDIARSVRITMARNETECVALALTSTSMQQPWATDVRLGAFHTEAGKASRNAPQVTGRMRVAGAIGSRHFGVNLGPLLAADNRLAPSLMRRYLTNGAGITQFPKLTLSKAGSAVVWLSVTTADAAPGRYEAVLSARGGPAVHVDVEVLDVRLPKPFVWLNSWSGTTTMFPFVYDDREAREVAYKQSLGITVWNGFPEPGSYPEAARQAGRTIHRVPGMPRKYVDAGYNAKLKPETLTETDRTAIAKHVRGLAKRAAELGLSYDDWYVELWDEPGRRNSLLYGALAKLVRQADPKVRIYCNPCFWEGTDVLGDEQVCSVLGSWYKEFVDISAPLFLLLRDRPKCYALFDAPRFVRASYAVSTQSAKSERADQVQLYRRQAWAAFERGWNGWGFYSYHAPRGNPWTDFDRSWTEDRPDYLMVYPGPRGPIPTRQSEAVREGWEDYCLLTLLNERGQGKELRSLAQAREAGTPLTELRLRALRIAARSSH